jgi:hypothetical protein
LFDTFSSLGPDADEVKDAPLIMRRLSDLSAAVDGTAVLVHLPGWGDSGRARGGYQIEANADEVLILTGLANESLVSLTRKKVKDGPSGSTVWLRRRLMADTVIFEHARPGDVEVPLSQRIVAVLDALGDVGATGPELMAECDVDDKAHSGFYASLRRLRDDQVKVTGTRKSPRYYRTEHAPDGAE